MLSIRKIGVIGRTYRHLNRYRQILGVLFKYGFGDLVETLKIEQYLEIGLQVISRKKREQIEKLTRAERIRMALEELGPTFIKLGQVLSTRPDLIPLEYVRELSKLQDHVPPFPHEKVREIVKEEMGRFPEEIFEKFDETPLAAASIGQVHRARLADGEVFRHGTFTPTFPGGHPPGAAIAPICAVRSRMDSEKVGEVVPGEPGDGCLH